MKKHFATGLVLLLPLALTLMILLFIINLLTRPFMGIVSQVMRQFGLFDQGFLFLSTENVQTIVGQIFVLIVIFFSVVLLGVFTRLIFAHYVIRFGDKIVNSIPFVRSIYKTFQDVIKTVFTSKTNAFKQVVLVPFPNKDTFTVGLVTRENITQLHPQITHELVAVFVPTTPNPTSGFMMMYPPKDLIYLDMSIEEAFKYIVSCGVVYDPKKVNEVQPAPASEYEAEPISVMCK
jgi:uncharacterized membrane protein